MSLYHINFVFATHKFCLCKICSLSLQHIIYVFATYNICLCTMLLYLQYLNLYLQCIQCQKNQILCVYKTKTAIMCLQKRRMSLFGREKAPAGALTPSTELFCLYNIYILSLRHIIYVLATYNICLCTMFLYLQYINFYFNTYKVQKIIFYMST